MGEGKKLTRKTLILNGVVRHITCDPEKDTLALAIRRMGLTGTKIGCGTGVCGACSLILNGKVTRACTVKMKRVEDFSEILTIEGIGTPQNLHPLQQAWITYGGVQCGFCTPGFIVSAYGLLQENPAPTREEVRDWFTKHHNLCRCTGYKPLVDAVMAAAAVMRGEKTMEDIQWKMPEDAKVYGSRMPRPAALAKVTGLADYGDDIALQLPEGVAYLAPVLAGVPHAKLKGIDVSEVEKVCGVIRVLTSKDIKGTNDISFPAIVPRQKGKGAPKFPIMVEDTISHRGDCVAVVAAYTREAARAAAKLVKLDLEPLPAYMSILESAMPDAMQLHDTVPNMYLSQPVYKGEDTEAIFEDENNVVVEGSFHSQHEPHLPIEPDVFQAYTDPDGMLTIQSKTHDLYGCGAELAPAIGVDKSQVRMIMNPTGGSFGYCTLSNVFALAGMATLALDMPVSMTLSYEEHQHMTGKRSATYTNARMAASKDGKIQAVEFDCGMDHGAYAGTASIAFGNLVSVPFSAYNVPNVKILARAGTSNHDYTCAYRGFGGPQIYTMSEAITNMAAEKLGMDPWEFRYKNAARPGDLTINNRPFKDYQYVKLLETIKPDYDEFKAEAAKAKAEGRHVGVGLAAGGFNVGKGFIDHCENDLELLPDGKIAVYNTWQDIGQGADIGTLTHVMTVLAPLGLKPGDVRLVMNDTKICPDSGLSAASRSHYMNGRALVDGARQLLDAMRKPDGSYRSYEEMKAENIPTRYRGHVDEMAYHIDPCQDPNTGEGDRFSTYTYGVHTALVEVDVNTGKTKVLRYASAVDVGPVGNRLAVEGQGYGGISHCIGFALQEDYDASDRAGNMVYCGIPDCELIPDDIRLHFIEDNPREHGPQGSSGAAEVFQCSGHMAVINGIVDACGVRVYDLPAKPAKVKEGWEKLQRGEDLTPTPYFFGTEFEDELDEIAANPM